MCVDPRLLEKSMMGIFFMHIALKPHNSSFITPFVSPLLIVLPPFSDHLAHTSLSFFLLPLHNMTNIKTI